jgi:predicted metalloprotease
MRWRGRRQSSNIEDRRGQGGFGGGRPGGFRIPVGMSRTSRAGGGLGIVGLLILLGIGWLLGVNPLALLSGIDGGTPVVVGGGQSGEVGTPVDEGGQFVATVLADTEDTWSRIFADGGGRYALPTLVLFSRSTESACGFATAATGPFYCPGDSRVYIDLAFYADLRDRFGAPGDMAQAYVIAHEIGHHVQSLLGTLRPGRSSGAESDAVRVELQADCYAGMWARSADERGLLEVGDIDEALTAAAAIGDDTLQRQSQGYVVPDSFTHGTSEQRSRWFKRGYNQGDIAACDTFSTDAL